jgi:hypothetical protein
VTPNCKNNGNLKVFVLDVENDGADVHCHLNNLSQINAEIYS